MAQSLGERSFAEAGRTYIKIERYQKRNSEGWFVIVASLKEIASKVKRCVTVCEKPTQKGVGCLCTKRLHDLRTHSTLPACDHNRLFFVLFIPCFLFLLGWDYSVVGRKTIDLARVAAAMDVGHLLWANVNALCQNNSAPQGYKRFKT